MSDYPKEVIEQIKEIDLLTYLENYEPYELVKINERMYSTREHDSLKISNGLWCWWSRGIGGKNALKFLMVVRGMSYDDAVELLVNKTAIAPPVYSKPIQFEKAKKLILPEKAVDNSRLSRYLQWNRGIDEEIVEYCIKNDLIFEGLFTSKKSGKTFRNAIFVGYNPSGQAKYAAYRSLDSNRYMGDCTGSTKEYSFRLGHNTTDNELHLFECAIDALSYATLLNMYGHNWQSYNLVSLAGVYQPKEKIEESKVPIALAKYLKENPNIDTVMLHLDNDYVGRMATKALKIILPKHIKVIDSPPTLGKDVNDFLRIKKGLIKPFKYNWRNDKNAKKAYVLLVEPKAKPKIIQIEDSEQGIKSIVGGEVDRIKIPSDDVTILFQKDGVINGKTLNRVAEINEEKETEMSYSDLTSMFRKAEDEGKHIGGYITFTEDSFDKIYPLESRTYGVSSNNKAFRSGMGGYSIYGSSLDKTDMNVRLERYMYNEHGGADGWKIERCYIKEIVPIVNQVIADNFIVAYTPNGENHLSDITQELVDKYFKQFEKPDKFHRSIDGNIVVVNNKSNPNKDMER